MCNIRLPVLPNWLEKCEIEHWFPCGADGRSFVRCTVTWLPNFLGWVDLLTHGAPQARFARQSSAITIKSFSWKRRARSIPTKHLTMLYLDCRELTGHSPLNDLRVVIKFFSQTDTDMTTDIIVVFFFLNPCHLRLFFMQFPAKKRGLPFPPKTRNANKWMWHFTYPYIEMVESRSVLLLH